MKSVLFQTDFRPAAPSGTQDRQEEANGRRGVWFRGERPPDRHLLAAALLVRITVGAEGRRDSPVGIGSVQGPGLLGLWLRSSHPPPAQDPRGPPSSRAPETAAKSREQVPRFPRTLQHQTGHLLLCAPNQGTGNPCARRRMPPSSAN